MSNPSKQKGTAFETLICAYLVERGFKAAHRTALSGGYDTGDINGIVNYHTDAEVAVQCKNQKKFDLSGWLEATITQAERLNNAVPVLVVKRPGKGANSRGENYAVMRLSDVVSLLKEANYT